jgi:hypothetical protein
VKTYRILILLGLVLYVASFFLTAVKDSKTSAGMPGYKCATTALLAPWGGDGLNMLRETPVDYFALLFSGWINPVFLITALAFLIQPKGRFAGILRVVLLLMLPACWIVFYKAELRPAQGYFLWTAAMLLVLFSNTLIRSGARTAPGKPVDKNANIS